MKKLALLIVILLLLSSAWVANNGIQFTEKRVKVGENNIYVHLFKEPIEIVYLLMKDGTPYKITQNYNNRVYFNIYSLKKYLKKRNHVISGISIMVHNHLIPTRISDDDKKIFRSLIREGFNGAFVIFLQGVNQVLIYEEKK